MEGYRKILESQRTLIDTQIRWAVESMTDKPDASGDDWRAAALCQKLDPELFDDTYRNNPQIEMAKIACGVCLVSDQCLNYALKSNENALIYGGLTSKERRALRRKMNRSLR